MTYDLSIITVCYNCDPYIEKTLKSILAQKDNSVQYIVIDGASSDGTLGVLKQYSDKIDVIVSEPDNGIYDAMNKGIGLAEGKYILFINAGDILLKHSLEIAKKEFYQNLDLLYFSYYSLYRYKDINLRFKSKVCNEISHDMPTAHNVTFFSRDSFFKNGLYDTSYFFAADYEWICRNHLKLRSKHFETKIIEYLQGGLSEQHHIKVLFEKLKIATKYFGYKALAWHAFNLLKILPVYVLKKIALKLGLFHNYILIKHKISGT